jgi:hypothetical protein
MTLPYTPSFDLKEVFAFSINGGGPHVTGINFARPSKVPSGVTDTRKDKPSVGLAEVLYPRSAVMRISSP